jgi:release factor glutamine methyltransferase
MTALTLREALQSAQNQLAESTDSPLLDSEVLLAHTLDRSRTWLRTWPETLLSAEQQEQFDQLIARRQAGEPIAYLTGEREFWDMTLKVTPATLIPRPETERLVELALEKIPLEAHWRIADLGTGSGAIALAIAKERPHCQVMATDVSEAALAVAENNAARLGINNITFLQGRWFEPLTGNPFELIVSNPPYVHPEDLHLNQGDLRFEPRQALQSSPDGLSDIRTIAESARKHLCPPGWLLFEHGYDQGPAVKTLLEDSGFSQVSVVMDLAKNERVCLGKWETDA